MVEVEVTGQKEIQRVMNRLSEDLAVKVTRNAVRGATKIIQKEAIRIFHQKWHTRSGNLEDSIKVVKRKRIDGERVSKHTPTYSVMAKRVWKRKRYKDSAGNKITVKGLVADGYYAQFLEYGTSTIAAKPFLRPAAERKKDEAFVYFKKEILKEAKKITGGS
jgi:HK97 gp10 family phage protein